MSGIKIPQVFNDFASNYALDLREFDQFELEDDMDALIDNALQYITKPEEREVLKDFLTKVLDADADDAALVKLWSGRGIFMTYNKEAFRPFYTRIRDRL